MKGPNHKRARHARRLFRCPQTGRLFSTTGDVVSYQSPINSNTWCRVEDQRPVDQPMPEWEQIFEEMKVETAPEDGATEFVSANLPNRDEQLPATRSKTSHQQSTDITTESSAVPLEPPVTEPDNSFGEGLEIETDALADEQSDSQGSSSEENDQQSEKQKRRKRRRPRRRKKSNPGSTDSET